MKKFYLNASALLLLMCLGTFTAVAQLGDGWNEVNYWSPNATVQLMAGSAKSYPRVNRDVSYSNTATYKYVASSKQETFTVGGSGYRAEIKGSEEYERGCRQFQGYLTVKRATKHFVMQIWGSGSRETAITFALRVYSNGDIKPMGVDGANVIYTNCINKKLKINIIHMQEDKYPGGLIRVYINNAWKGDYDDKWTTIQGFGVRPETDGNYLKWGAYGDKNTSAQVVWENVRIFKDGRLPSKSESEEIVPVSGINLDVYPTVVTNNATISYTIPEAALTSVEVFNLNGQKINTVTKSYAEAGDYKLTLNTENYSKGVYIVKLVSGNNQKHVKVIVN